MADDEKWKNTKLVQPQASKLVQPQPANAKIKHRLLVKQPEEFGLTARIKKALVQQDMGITQRIKRAMEKTRDESSFFYMKKNHFIIIGVLLLLLGLFGYLAFRTRELHLDFKLSDGQTATETISLGVLDATKEVTMSYPRQVQFFRTDIYGNDFNVKTDYEITDKNKKMIKDPNHLMPGTYNLIIHKAGFKEQSIPVNVSEIKVEVPVSLEPLVEPLRKLQLTINDPMIEGKELEPDDVRIAKSNKSIRNVQVKAGTYDVIIEKAGYFPKEMEIHISEDGIVRDKITLDYKKRSVKFLVDDGLTEKGYELQVAPKEIQILSEGKEVEFKEALTPGYYDIVVTRDGYYEYKDKIKVLAGADLASFYLPLKMKTREVAVKTNYDIAPVELKVDKAYLSDLRGKEKEIIPVTEGLRVFPGKYWIRVEKANYYPYSKEIDITPSSDVFEIKAHLISVSKLVMLKITSDFEVDANINPDEMLFDTKISKAGYKGVDWGNQRSLPPEKKEIEVPIFLETIPRRVICEITSDIVPGPLKPDTMTVRKILEGREEGETIDLTKQGVELKPNRYMLSIQKFGYEDIREEQIVYPSVEPFVVRKEMKAQARPLIIKLDSDYEPNVSIVADEVRLDDNLTESGIRIKPKTYALVIRKAGYHAIEKMLKVEAGSEPIIVQETLQAKPRQLQYEIKGDNLAKIYPDSVTFDGNAVKEKTDIPTKKSYEVQIQKKGYATLKKAISVEPSDKPFILDEVLSPLKRNVHLVLEASYPKGKDLMPPESATLTPTNASSISIVQDVDVVPGQYSLSIIKAGYKSINETVDIEPSDVAYRIQRIMQPKERDVQTEITYDVDPEKSVEPIIHITSEDGTIDQDIKPGDKVLPNKYKVTVRAPGYEPLTEDVSVLPAETAYTFAHTLQASLRPVKMEITGDYPPGKALIPDKILMNGEPFAEGTLFKQMKPGRYSTLIDKEGYNTIQKEILIPAGTDDYVVKEQMASLPRAITYRFYDSEKKEKDLIPDQITFGTEVLGQGSTFKPGTYRLYVRIQGYPDIIEQHEITPGVEPYHITKGLMPSTRELHYEITGDYNTELLTPQEITLNGIPFINGGSFAPGSYDFVVYVPGYERLVKRIDFGADPKPFMIREQVQAKPRKVNFKIGADYPANVEIKPNRVTLNDQAILDGEAVKPVLGGYQVRVEKEGYKVEPKNIIIPPAEEAYDLEMTLEAKTRNIIFELTGNYKVGEKLTPDEITVDGDVYHGIEVYAPGKRNIEIKKAGYKPVVFTHDLLPGDAPETITKVMEAKERECNIVLNNRFTKEPMSAQDVDAAEIGGRSVLDGPYAPGTYDVFVAHPGYYDVRSKVEIVPGEGVQEMKYDLTPKKRIILPEVTYDCTPLPHSPEPQIHIISLETSEDTVIHRGDEIAPDTYRVRVEKEGYETTELERLTIFPDDRPFDLSIDMIASMVEILIEITYDIEPPATLAPYTVTFVDKKTGIGRNVTHGKRIKPGSYYLQVGKPGYEFPGGQKEIEVLPGTKPCQVSEKLFAKPRQLSFDMMSGTILIKAIEVLLDGKQVKAQDLFKPGQEHQLTAKFKEYQTATKTIVIPAGEGPYVVDVQLVKLNKFEFRIAKQYYSTEFGMIIDGLRYDLEVFVDNKEVEKHHIMREGGMSMIYGYYYALNSIKNLRILCGYYYDDSLASLSKPAIFKDLSKIDSARLMAHLREVAKINPATALKRMDTIMNDPLDKQKISQLPVEEREKIRDTLRDLELRDKKQQEKRNEILKKLGF